MPDGNLINANDLKNLLKNKYPKLKTLILGTQQHSIDQVEIISKINYSKS